MQKIILSLLLSATTLSQGMASDACDRVDGLWQMDATLHLPFSQTCHYTGSTEIVGNHEFTAILNLHPRSKFCPESNNIKVEGTCIDSKVTISNDYTRLDGSVSANEKLAQLVGYLHFPGSSDRVEVRLSR